MNQTIQPKVEISTEYQLMVREYYIKAPLRGNNTQVIKMKIYECESCKTIRKIPDDMINIINRCNKCGGFLKKVDGD